MPRKQGWLLSRREGISHWFIPEPDNQWTYRICEDVEPVLKHAKTLSDTVPKGEGHRLIGVMPRHVLNRMIAEGWDQEQLRHWYEQPENARFRVHDDTVDPRKPKGIIIK